MKQQSFVVAVVLLIALILGGCSAASRLRSSLGNKFRYTYKLVSPSAIGRLAYQDKKIRMLYKLDDSAIRFFLRNLSDAPMKVEWKDVSLGIRGRFSGVRNTRSLYLQDPTDSGSPAILPGGYTIDMVIPAQNIYNDGMGWHEHDLLPTTDRNSSETRQRIRKNLHSDISLVMPIRFGDGSPELYTFHFEVTSVDSLPWDRYRRPRRPVPPPSTTRVKTTTTDQLITAVVVAGLVGVTVFLVTQKKSPVVE